MIVKDIDKYSFNFNQNNIDLKNVSVNSKIPVKINNEGIKILCNYKTCQHLNPSGCQKVDAYIPLLEKACAA